MEKIFKLIKIIFLSILFLWGVIGFTLNVFYTGERVIGFGFGAYSILALALVFRKTDGIN